jgi:uncharacterized membrane protein (DUF4010 family)
MNPDPDSLRIYQGLALALGIGLIFGIERGWRQREQPARSRAAGVRTFTLIGLLGGIAGVLGRMLGDAIAVAIFVAIAAFVLAAHVTGLPETRDRSITRSVAALLTFALGLLAVRGDRVLAASAAVVAVALLDLRETIHGWLQGIEKAELTAAIKLLLISVVVLPILPDRGFGPGGVLNPFELWWMVVLVASISFAGYAAIRIVGPRHGLLLTGALGGLASSTAVTVTCARLVASMPALHAAASAAIAAASAVSLGRTIVLAAVLSLAVGGGVAPALIPGLIGSLLAMGLQLRAARALARHDAGAARLDLGPPADLGLAVKFGLFLALFTLVVWYAGDRLGESAVIAASAVSGLIDVDAVTVSLARQGAGDVAARGILAAVAVNVAVKGVYAIAIAGRALLRPMAVVVGMTLAGIALGLIVFAG